MMGEKRRSSTTPESSFGLGKGPEVRKIKV